MSAAPRILLIGAAETRDLRPVFAACAEATYPHNLRRAPRCPARQGPPADDWDPDLIVVCQQASEEYGPDDVVALRTLFPWARLIVAYGPWCASDGRTHDVWPLAVRVPALDAPLRLAAELAALADPAVPRAPLPWTAARDEIALVEALEGRPAQRRREISVHLETPDPAVADWLATQLNTLGCEVTPDAGDAQVRLIDVDPWHPARAADLASPTPRPIVALAGFPTAELAEDLRAAGCAALVSKFAPPAVLAEVLEEVVAGRPLSTLRDV